VTTVGYALRRLGASIVLLLLLTLLTFTLYRAIPANPAGFLVDIQHSNADQVAKAEDALDLHRPLYEQYGSYVWRALHGDLGIAYQGTSIAPDGSREGKPVGRAVVRAAMVTGSLVVGGALLALLLSIPLGAIAASRPRSFTDRTILVVSLIGICTHPLVVALLLQQFPGRQWGLAPSSGYCPFFGTAGEPEPTNYLALAQDLGCAGPRAWTTHLILPWITFALFFLAIYTRLVRVRMLEVMEEPYIRTAAAKGASRTRIVRGHALRNAMGPVLTLVGMDVGLALGIALYVESVYRLPGLGLTTLGALNGEVGFDLPMILGIVLVIGVVIVVVNFAIDLTVAWMDPRATQGGTRGTALGRIA
jgi:peptide/nickel transport system permease protein